MNIKGFGLKNLPKFDPYSSYYSEVQFKRQEGVPEEIVMIGVNKLLAEMEIQIVYFIPVECRHRVKWYVKMPTEQHEKGAVGWDYIRIKKKK